MITKVEKRDGRMVDFDKERIINAIRKAGKATNSFSRDRAKKLSEQVVKELNKNYLDDEIPTVEDIQDIVENILIKNGHAKTAKAYILYRQKRKEEREVKAALGIKDDIKLSFNAIQVLEKRYLRRDEDRNIIETPGGMFRRVAKDVAKADELYDKYPKKSEEIFYNMMKNLEFLPNSPTLMNAGTRLQQLSACFVLPVNDSMASIFESLKNTALIHKSGGGTGFTFTHLRPKGDVVQSTGGIASGPISFMDVYNAATEAVKQGGKRRGANMAILNVDHPDILDFIVAKEQEGSLNNFNISVGATDTFMEAVNEDKNYDMINPRTGEKMKSLSAGRVFDLIITMAWKNGEPGMIFLDKMEEDNPTPNVGKIESTNPCGEQPLLPYESCNLGSINLAKHIKNGEVDWDKLKETVHNAVHFLDNVIDRGKFPIKKIEEMVHNNRKIGLGVMGFADMLLLLKIPYNSEKGRGLAEKIMKFISAEAKKKSHQLAKKRGVFPNFEGSVYDNGNDEDRVRNATRTTIAPTGTISIIANCSSGIEPLFAISFVRHVMTNTELLEVNEIFEKLAKEEGFYNEKLMKKISKQGSLQAIDEIPENVKNVFVTAHDITPEDHVRMQAAWQKYVDNAISKTVNFPQHASTGDVAKVFKMAYELGCKGITIYRDKSRQEQVLNIKDEKSRES